jgi:hypothetical protein
VFVVGPRGAGKTRWVQHRIRQHVAAEPGGRCAVVLAEEGHTRMERFARDVPAVAVRRLLLPCPCCPALAQLPETIRQVIGETGATRLYVEVPATAAAGLLAEFDRDPGWPRRLVLCLDEKWDRLRRRDDGPLFLSALVADADEIVTPRPPDAGPNVPPSPTAI